MAGEENSKNPFKRMKALVLGNIEFSNSSFESELDLQAGEAKILWLCCPEFQEKFSREWIHMSKARGGNEYGSWNWLRRRYRLSDDEASIVLREIWDQSPDAVSERFLEVLSADRIAKSQLMPAAQHSFEKLKKRFESRG